MNELLCDNEACQEEVSKLVGEPVTLHVDGYSARFAGILRETMVFPTHIYIVGGFAFPSRIIKKIDGESIYIGEL